MKPDSSSFVRIEMEVLVPGTPFPGDVFLKLGQDNFVLIGREGTKENFAQLHFYDQIKTAGEIFVKRTDHRKFTAQKVLATNEIIKDSHAPLQDKLNVLGQTASSVFASISHLGFDHESLGHAKFVSTALIKVIDENPKLTTLMKTAQSVSEDLIRHSMAVAMVSVMISMSKGWNNPAMLEKMALGAFLHDIGLKEYQRDFLKKPRVEFTPEDFALYEKHPFRGVEILRTVDSVPQEVISIVFEHHENSLGQGFPRGLRDVRLHPFSKVVALADTFSEIVLPDTGQGSPKDPEEAISFIEFVMGQPFNKECFNSLKNVLVFGVKKASVKLV